VFRANIAGESCAVKVLHNQELDPDVLQDFVNEIEIMRWDLRFVSVSYPAFFLLVKFTILTLYLVMVLVQTREIL